MKKLDAKSWAIIVLSILLSPLVIAGALVGVFVMGCVLGALALYDFLNSRKPFDE